MFSCEVGFVKPERQIYDHLLLKLAVPASQVLFVDDVGDNVEGAERRDFGRPCSNRSTTFAVFSTRLFERD